jgi:glycosyltransferase involved in cell wall biosynthesis
LKPKILFILHLPPPVHGAAIVGKFIKQSEKVKETFNCDFINLSTSSEMEEIGKGGIKKLINVLKLQLKVLKSLLSRNYSLCYLTLTAAGVGFFKDLTIITILKLFNKKIVFHFHNKGVNESSRSWHRNILYKFAFQNTKSILLSPKLYLDFKKYIQPKDVYYCPNGIPTINTSDVTSTISTHSKIKILFLSNMIAEKGVYLLLEACKRLKNKKIEFECHFVGSWTNISETEFKNFTLEFNLHHHVFSHGPLYGYDKQKLYINSDIFVLPTFYKNESFPLVLLEAMNYSLPIISTHEGGIPDIVIDNETGYLVPPIIDELVLKLEVLINDPDLGKKLGNAGKQRFLEFYTIEKFEKNFVEVLDSIINNN